MTTFMMVQQGPPAVLRCPHLITSVGELVPGDLNTAYILPGLDLILHDYELAVTSLRRSL